MTCYLGEELKNSNWKYLSSRAVCYILHRLKGIFYYIVIGSTLMLEWLLLENIQDNTLTSMSYQTNVQAWKKYNNNSSSPLLKSMMPSSMHLELLKGQFNQKPLSSFTHQTWLTFFCKTQRNGKEHVGTAGVFVFIPLQHCGIHVALQCNNFYSSL